MLRELARILSLRLIRPGNASRSSIDTMVAAAVDEFSDCIVAEGTTPWVNVLR
jgi:hypothetical protein